jgi:hypothetical protein
LAPREDWRASTSRRSSAIDQYAEAALGNREFLEERYGIGGSGEDNIPDG